MLLNYEKVEQQISTEKLNIFISHVTSEASTKQCELSIKFVIVSYAVSLHTMGFDKKLTHKTTCDFFSIYVSLVFSFVFLIFSSNLVVEILYVIFFYLCVPGIFICVPDIFIKLNR